MGVIMQPGYSLPGADQPLTHARIAHSGNWLTGGTVTASTTDSDYFADGPDDSMTYEKWKPTALAATWQYTFSGSSTFNYCVIAGHTLCTNGNSLQVQTYASGAWTNLIQTTGMTSDMPVFCIFATQTDTAARVRLTIDGTLPTIGVIKFGNAMQMPRPIYGGHNPIHLARQPEMRTNSSVKGQFLGRSVIRGSNSSSFSWSHIEADWVRTNWQPFQIAAENEPFFVAWRPETFSEVAYGYVNETPSASNMGIKDLMSVGFDLTAESYT